MTPQGFIIVILGAVIMAAAFMFDNKKAKKIRAEIDARYNGRHTVDFKKGHISGYIADNTLFIKERVRGYLIIDLTKVEKISLSLTQCGAYIGFWDERGKPVGDSEKIKSMFGGQAKAIIKLVCENASWIQWENL